LRNQDSKTNVFARTGMDHLGAIDPVVFHRSGGIVRGAWAASDVIVTAPSKSAAPVTDHGANS